MKKENKKKYGVLKFIVLLIAIVLIAVSLTRISYELYQTSFIYDTREINASFQIGDRIGMSADTDVLNFGSVYKGSLSMKRIELYHEYKLPLKIVIEYKGNISEVLSSVEPFYLEPKTKKELVLVASANKQLGSYFGIVKISYLKK